MFVINFKLKEYGIELFGSVPETICASGWITAAIFGCERMQAM